MALTVDLLVVAGGGGGGGAVVGSQGCGGGGAGAMRSVAGHTVTVQAYTVTVGGGGNGGTSADGANGTNSVFDTITATGGGGGAGVVTAGTQRNGLNGGSGGGASGGGSSAGTGTTGGNNGGTGSGSGSNFGGGGGGGATAVGANGTGSTGGTGGAGTASSISGASVTYAGGGGGGTYIAGTVGTGGAGGGANAGASGGGNGLAGTANRGGGGGGASTNASTAYAGGAGGSGVVIISYPTGSLSASGGTITASGGNTIHTFTASDTFTVLAAGGGGSFFQLFLVAVFALSACNGSPAAPSIPDGPITLALSGQSNAAKLWPFLEAAVAHVAGWAYSGAMIEEWAEGEPYWLKLVPALHQPGLSALVWSQGENNYIDGVGVYRQKLAAFLARVRQEAGLPHLRVIILSPARRSVFDEVRAEQQAYVRTDPDARLVRIDDLPNLEDEAHLTDEGYRLLVPRIVDAIRH